MQDCRLDLQDVAFSPEALVELMEQPQMHRAFEGNVVHDFHLGAGRFECLPAIQNNA